LVSPVLEAELEAALESVYKKLCDWVRKVRALRDEFQSMREPSVENSLFKTERTINLVWELRNLAMYSPLAPCLLLRTHPKATKLRVHTQQTFELLFRLMSVDELGLVREENVKRSRPEVIRDAEKLMLELASNLLVVDNAVLTDKDLSHYAFDIQKTLKAEIAHNHGQPDLLPDDADGLDDKIALRVLDLVLEHEKVSASEAFPQKKGDTSLPPTSSKDP